MMLSLYFIQDTRIHSLCMQIGVTPAPEVRVVLKRRKLQERHVNAVYTELVII